jgi:hypothetical protein
MTMHTFTSRAVGATAALLITGAFVASIAVDTKTTSSDTFGAATSIVVTAPRALDSTAGAVHAAHHG